MRFNRAFTLVELLVVVAIIVVLLALMLPALDKAMYQAELAACGANLKGIATGAQTYAVGYKRYYPLRKNVSGTGAQSSVNVHFAPNDDRIPMGTTISMKNLLCPLTGKVLFDKESTTASNVVASSYGLWFGYQFLNERGMFKLGDRFTYGYTAAGSSVSYQFRLLAGDSDSSSVTSHSVFNSHPDKNGVMWDQVLQNVKVGTEAGGMVVNGYTYTLSRWTNIDTQLRGAVENNYVYDDGSVKRFDDVVIKPDGTHDDRFTDINEVANFADKNARLGTYAHLPRD